MASCTQLPHAATSPVHTPIDARGTGALEATRAAHRLAAAASLASCTLLLCSLPTAPPAAPPHSLACHAPSQTAVRALQQALP